MHELFLSTQVANEDLQRALRILQGYCGMKPVTFLRRRLIWEGPRMRNGLKGIDAGFLKRQSQPIWRSLHEQLIRQSYIITLLYDVKREQFGEGEKAGVQDGEEGQKEEDPVIDCDQLLGILRWTDLPDPAGGRPVNSRLLVNIENERGLCTLLKSMNHRLTQEMIQECHRFVLGNVVFDFSRYLQLPPSDTELVSSIRSKLPAYESLVPFDAENKWVLTASALVFNGSVPDHMQKGIDELMTVKTDFEGCFDFQALDRHIFDTRVKI
ncbi:Mediator complex, subunit Med18 [Hyaloscypha variabilis]